MQSVFCARRVLLTHVVRMAGEELMHFVGDARLNGVHEMTCIVHITCCNQLPGKSKTIIQL